MKKIVVVFICLLLFAGIKVSADDGYSENYGTFVGDTFDEFLDNDTKQKLYGEGLTPESPSWVENLRAENVFSYILSLLRGGIKKPFTALLSITGITVLFAAFSAFGEAKYIKAAEIAAPAAVAIIMSVDIYACVTAAAEAVKGSASFMIGFIPALVSLMAASGATVTSAASSVTLLASANAVASFAANGVLPLMGGYLGVSIASGVSPAISKVNPAAALRRVTMWVLSLVSTVFLGVLSVQTSVSSAADGVTFKTAKFVLGTSVPVAGGVLSEAVSALSSSLGLLKSSVGIYAAVALAAVLLPVVIEIILWRICFALSGVVASLFGEERVSALLKATDAVLSCILGIVLLAGALFVISLGIVVSARNSV